MRKLYKHMSLEAIAIELDDGCEAKDLSRVKFRVFEDGDTNSVHTTKFYANIHDNKIQWTELLQLRYTGQTRLTFQTFCEHQFGYQQQELKVLYRGVYYLRNEMFFKRDTTHIYDLEGEKKGVLRWQIKVVVKQEEMKGSEQIKQKEMPLVREDLIGMIKLHQAILQISNPVFNVKKYQDRIKLRIKFDKKEYDFEIQQSCKWRLNNLKLQYIINGSKAIDFQLLDQNKSILEGKTQCENVEQLRRYINHRVPLFNKNYIRIGSLVLDYRYIAKQQLLDLIYSPNNKLNYSFDRCQSSTESYKATSSHGLLSKLVKRHNESSSSIFELSHSQIRTQSRYKIGYLMNQNSDIKIPKATRFGSSQAVNPNISYLDPQKISDFTVKKEKGPYITKSNKFDFTRQFKDNPGVGSYKLPSIWSKY